MEYKRAKSSFQVESYFYKVVWEWYYIRNNENYLEYINCNICINQGFHLSPIFFVIYNDKLEGCLEQENCLMRTLVGIVIILLLYLDDNFLIWRSPYDLKKKLRILEGFFSNTRVWFFLSIKVFTTVNHCVKYLT